MSYSIPFNFNIGLSAQIFQVGQIWALKVVNQEKVNYFLKQNLIGCDLSVLFLYLATVEKRNILKVDNFKSF